MLKKLGLPALALGALLFAFSPSAAWARGEGGHGSSGGHGSARGGGGFSGGGGNHFSSGRGFSGGGERSAPQRFSAGRGYDAGRGYSEGARGFVRGGRDYGYYRGGGGLYFGYGAPYVYGPSYYYPGACNPGGYYDQWGNWQPYPGCSVAPGYGYNGGYNGGY